MPATSMTEIANFFMGLLLITPEGGESCTADSLT
jgi:hypothetical protein